MIRIEPTENFTGVTVQGDYDDLYNLVFSIHGMLGLVDDVKDPYYGVKMRLLGVCYDLRHAYQRDRLILLEDNGMDEESMEWHEIITPKQNVYYGVEILFPEIIYLAMMLPVLIESGRRNYGPRKSSQVEKSRLTLSEYLGDKASLEVFAAGAWQALAKVIGQEETDKIHIQMTKTHEMYGFFLPQYVDKLNVEYLNTPIEKRKAKLLAIAKRTLKKPEAYYNYEKGFMLSARELNVSIYELEDPKVNYPEDILW